MGATPELNQPGDCQSPVFLTLGPDEEIKPLVKRVLAEFYGAHVECCLAGKPRHLQELLLLLPAAQGLVLQLQPDSAATVTAAEMLPPGTVGRLTSLALQGASVTDELLRDIFSVPFPALQTLRIMGGSTFRAAGLGTTVAQAPALVHLHLQLDEPTNALETLAQPSAQRLVTLTLEGPGITDELLRTLFGRWFSSLQSLKIEGAGDALKGSWLGQGLANTPALKSLEVLHSSRFWPCWANAFGTLRLPLLEHVRLDLHASALGGFVSAPLLIPADAAVELSLNLEGSADLSAVLASLAQLLLCDGKEKHRPCLHLTGLGCTDDGEAGLPRRLETLVHVLHLKYVIKCLSLRVAVLHTARDLLYSLSHLLGSGALSATLPDGAQLQLNFLQEVTVKRGEAGHKFTYEVISGNLALCQLVQARGGKAPALLKQCSPSLEFSLPDDHGSVDYDLDLYAGSWGHLFRELFGQELPAQP